MSAITINRPRPGQAGYTPNLGAARSYQRPTPSVLASTVGTKSTSSSPVKAPATAISADDEDIKKAEREIEQIEKRVEREIEQREKQSAVSTTTDSNPTPTPVPTPTVPVTKSVETDAPVATVASPPRTASAQKPDGPTHREMMDQLKQAHQLQLTKIAALHATAVRRFDEQIDSVGATMEHMRGVVSNIDSNLSNTFERVAEFVQQLTEQREEMADVKSAIKLLAGGGNEESPATKAVATTIAKKGATKRKTDDATEPKKKAPRATKKTKKAEQDENDTAVAAPKPKASISRPKPAPVVEQDSKSEDEDNADKIAADEALLEAKKAKLAKKVALLKAKKAAAAAAAEAAAAAAELESGSDVDMDGLDDA